MKFRKRIAENEILIAGLAAGGYILDMDEDDENHCKFNPIDPTDISSQLLISIFDRASFQVGLIIRSSFVGKMFQLHNLFLDQPFDHEGSPIGVLAVDLLWLRWNSDPENAEIYRNDYSYVNEAGATRVFDDLDTLGKTFISNVASSLQLADSLVNLSAYPIRTKLGGRPASSDPFTYAALLYIQSGNLEKACDVLDQGLAEYSFSEPGAEWQVRRYNNLNERRRLLLPSL